MFNEKRTVDFLLADYTTHVREAAIRALLAAGYLGIDPRTDGSGPKSLDELRAMASSGATRFPVNTDGSDQTVFTDPTVNLLFRAWHDIGHLVLNQPFTREGERAVAAWQMSYLKGIDKQIMWSDIVDQYDYYAEHGEFVKDQRAFVIGKVFGELDVAVPHFVTELEAA